MIMSWYVLSHLDVLPGSARMRQQSRSAAVRPRADKGATTMHEAKRRINANTLLACRSRSTMMPVRRREWLIVEWRGRWSGEAAAGARGTRRQVQGTLAGKPHSRKCQLTAAPPSLSRRHLIWAACTARLAADTITNEASPPGLLSLAIVHGCYRRLRHAGLSTRYDTLYHCEVSRLFPASH